MRRSVTFVSRLLTVIVTIRCRQFAVSRVATFGVSVIVSAVRRVSKRVVSGCHVLRFGVMFQRPYVPDGNPYFVRSVGIRSSRRVRMDIPHSPSLKERTTRTRR